MDTPKIETPLDALSRLFQKLQRCPEYRKGALAAQVNIGVPIQLRALLKSRGWTQAELAERTQTCQAGISALLKPGRANPTVKTLVRLAKAFDVGLVIRFVPFNEIGRWSRVFDPLAVSCDRAPWAERTEQIGDDCHVE